MPLAVFQPNLITVSNSTLQRKDLARVKRRIWYVWDLSLLSLFPFLRLFYFSTPFSCSIFLLHQNPRHNTIIYSLILFLLCLCWVLVLKMSNIASLNDFLIQMFLKLHRRISPVLCFKIGATVVLFFATSIINVIFADDISKTCYK